MSDHYPILRFVSNFLLGISLFSFNSCQKDAPTIPQVFPPEANFSASTTNIFKGMSIDFIDLSTVNPSSWAWAFSGGTASAIGGSPYGSACFDVSTAWGIFDYLLYNNYNDWKLPSATTLLYMYQNLHLKGYGNFSPDYYWSYCETDDYNSKSVTFSDGSISDYGLKNSSRRVRAIRQYFFYK